MQKRVFILFILFVLYFSVNVLDSGFEMLLSSNNNSKTIFDITESHFRQPKEFPVLMKYYKMFFSRIESDYDKIWFLSPISYSVLLLIFLTLPVIIFTKLFSAISRRQHVSTSKD